MRWMLWKSSTNKGFSWTCLTSLPQGLCSQPVNLRDGYCASALTPFSGKPGITVGRLITSESSIIERAFSQNLDINFLSTVLQHNNKMEYVWNSEDFLGCLSVLLCLQVNPKKDHGNISEKDNLWIRSYRNENFVINWAQEPCLAVMLTETKGNRD